MTTTLLDLRGVVAGYGRGDVLRGVDLAVERGAITCLIGPNGAGKSTVLKTVSGLLRPRAGTISLEDVAIGGLAPPAVLAHGVVHVPQERSLFPSMSVWDNLLMGAFVLRDRALVRQRAEAVAERFPIVDRERHARAGSLSGGEQKMIEIARAFMLEPVLLLMDEPSTGLDPKARRAVFEIVEGISRDGTTVLLVEQNARSALAIAHHGVVMDGGVVRLRGTGARLLDDPEVARLYLGSSKAAVG